MLTSPAAPGLKAQWAPICVLCALIPLISPPTARQPREDPGSEKARHLPGVTRGQKVGDCPPGCPVQRVNTRYTASFLTLFQNNFVIK